ncbi:MAG: hypothetical protein EBU26_16645 [Verrucomicrobia bacterium]|nr:hypothetical protein [Verrucomicrobiota bacterium]
MDGLAPCTGMDKANARAKQITLVDIFSEFIIVKSFLLCGCDVVKKSGFLSRPTDPTDHSKEEGCGINLWLNDYWCFLQLIGYLSGFRGYRYFYRLSIWHSGCLDRWGFLFCWCLSCSFPRPLRKISARP